MNFPGIHNPGSIETLLNKISSIEVPKLVDEAYLRDIGFVRDVDIRLLDMLAFLGFTCEDNTPAKIWNDFIESGGNPLILGQAVLTAYEPLFKEYSDAADLESKYLMVYFTDNSDDTGQEAAYVTLTFKVLCDLAEFPEEKEELILEEHEPVDEITEEAITEIAEEVEEEEVADEIEPQVEPEIITESTPALQETEAADIPTEKKIKISICIDIDDDLEDDPDLKSKLFVLINKKLNENN